MVQGTWTPTRPRRPIAAEFQTPGPGHCNIPSTIGKETPAFTMANRHEIKNKKVVPSPNEYNTRQLTNKGKDIAPARTIAGRPKDLKKFQTPAPGTYEAKDDVMQESSPRYTFGLKPTIEHPDGVPAPNAYNMPDDLGDGPRYTMPARPRDPKQFQTPAPGTYEAKDDVMNESSPRYTFGLKPSIEHPDGVPAPNSYNIPDELGEGPRWAMPGRGREVVDERTKFPAPCEYEMAKADASLHKSPAYTLRDRTAIPTDRTKKPGPGAYNLDDKPTKARDPQYSFGLKHSPYLGAFKPATPDRAVSLSTSAIKPTDKVLRGGEVVRVTPEGLTCRWVDRGLSPRTNGTTNRTVETRTNADGSTTTRETTRVHRTFEMTR